MTSLKDMVLPIIKLSCWCTLAPFIFSKNPHKEYAAIGKRPFYIIRITILILFTEFLQSEVLKRAVVSAPPKGLNRIIVATVRNSVPFLILIGFPLCTVATYWSSSKLAEFMNNLKQIATDMEEIGFSINYRRKYKWYIFQICSKLLQMVSSVVGFLVYINGSFKHTFIMALYCTPYMLNLLILVQWTSFVNLLTMHFKCLNRFLKTLKYRQCFMVEDFSKARRKPVIVVIEGCAAIYDRLVDESRRLNEAYAWQIFYLIPHYFLLTLYNIYDALLSFKNDTPLPILVLSNGLLSTVYILEFIIPCALCKEEASRFSEILNRVDLKLHKSAELEELVSEYCAIAPGSFFNLLLLVLDYCYNTANLSTESGVLGF